METTRTHDRMVAQSSALSKQAVKDMISPEEVAGTLEDAGVDFVLAGAHAIGPWTRRPRATVDVDVVIAAPDHVKAVEAIRRAYPNLIERDLPVVTRFAMPDTGDVVIDLMRGTEPLMRAVFGNTTTVEIGGRKVRIPDLEMAAAMKFAAMVGIYRKRADKAQDGADFMRIIDANPNLDTTKLGTLADLVYAGGSVEVCRLVEAIRKGEPLVF